MFTMILPILAGIFLMARSRSGADLFAVLNRAFGAGVFAQTFLRSVVLLKWLTATGIPYHVSMSADGAAGAALAGVLGQSLREPSAQPQPVEIPRQE